MVSELKSLIPRVLEVYKHMVYLLGSLCIKLQFRTDSGIHWLAPSKLLMMS